MIPLFRFLTTVLFIGSLSTSLSLARSPQKSDRSADSPKIEVNLIVPTKVIKSGGGLHLMVRITNVSGSSLILPNGFGIDRGADAYLDLEIMNAKGELSPKMQLHGDWFPPTDKPNKLSSLMTSWLF